MHQFLRRLLAAHLRDEPADPYYSVLVGEPDGSGPADRFHFLYEAANAVVRTRDPERLVRGLLSHLARFAPEEDTPCLVVEGTALVKQGRALVAPSAVTSWLKVVERRLNIRGFQVVDSPWLRLDPAAATLVVREPALDVDWSAFDVLDGVVPRPARPDPAVAPGAYPLTGWALLTPDGQPGPLPRAQAVLWATMLVLNRHQIGGQRTLDGLADVMRLVQPVGVGWSDERELVDALDRAAAAGPDAG